MKYKLHFTLRWLIIALSILTITAAGWADTKRGDISTYELEDLLRVPVTSVTKTEQKVANSPAAVFVITREDIRHSGMTSVPELLRMVPGLDVAHINASQWAVSSRGFNARFANKLLVMIDGRSLYSLSTEAVYWELQNVMVEDIERIEVIRGPGATLWGAGAVSGVINIIMKSAADTQGTLLTASVGTQERANGGIRYGGQMRHGTYRASLIGFDQNPFAAIGGGQAFDDWHMIRGGARADLDLSARDTLNLVANGYGGDQNELKNIFSFAAPYFTVLPAETALSGANFSAQWARTYANKSTSSLRVYFDRYRRLSPTIGMLVNSLNVDFQAHLPEGPRNDIVWGAEYRQTHDSFDPNKQETFTPAARIGHLFGGFLEDDITVSPDLFHVIAGVRLDHAPFTSVLAEPTLRLLWTPTRNLSLWSAYSLTQRAPDRAHRGLSATAAMLPPQGNDELPTAIGIYGAPDTVSEHVQSIEVGTRYQFRPALSVDVAAFRNAYGSVQTLSGGEPLFVPQPAAHVVIPMYFGNQMHGNGYGGEVIVRYTPIPMWKFSGSYSFQLATFAPSEADLQVSMEMPAGRSPHHQAQVRSQFDFTRRFEFDQSLYYVGQLSEPAIPAYTRLDLRLAYRLSHSLEIAVVGQNLLDRSHLEFVDSNADTSTKDIRKAAVKLSWQF